jgi:hypothetical protein
MSQRLRSIPDFASRKLVRFRAKAIGLRGTLVTLLAGTFVPPVKWNFSSTSKNGTFVPPVKWNFSSTSKMEL